MIFYLQGNEIAAKILALRECTPRISRDFNEEYPKVLLSPKMTIARIGNNLV